MCLLFHWAGDPAIIAKYMRMILIINCERTASSISLPMENRHGGTVRAVIALDRQQDRPRA